MIAGTGRGCDGGFGGRGRRERREDELEAFERILRSGARRMFTGGREGVGWHRCDGYEILRLLMYFWWSV